MIQVKCVGGECNGVTVKVDPQPTYYEVIDPRDPARRDYYILEVGAWVLTNACRQAGRWRREHPTRPLLMRVNLSDIIAKGISEALVATQTGMMVAIPGLLCAFLVKRWRNEYVAFLARLEGLTLRHFRPIFHGMTRQWARTPETAAAVVAQPAHAAAHRKEERELVSQGNMLPEIVPA